MVRWAAIAISRCSVGNDGKTSFERLRGRPCRQEVLLFGENVWYKELYGKGNKDEKLGPKWLEGVWLGHQGHTNEPPIGTPEGTINTWAVKRKTEEDQWSKDAVENMLGSPS